MTSLASELSAIVGEAFAAENLPSAFGQVQTSDRPDLAQFQCNGALPAAKQAKTNPRAIAERIAARLKTNELIAKVEIAGPGFINIDVADSALNERAERQANDRRLNVPEIGHGKTLVIDYGGPNVAKAMHVGHLRSSIIGDCLQRLFRANGWTVISDVHLGDWGLQMGQLLMEVRRRGIAPVYFDEKFAGPYPEQSPVSMEDLEDLYPAASAACKADPERLEEARKATAELQSGRPGYRALWQHFVSVSEAGLKREFSSLGIGFDLWKGEADANPLIPGMIDALKSKGLAVIDDGALVVHVARPTDKKEMPPLLLLKSDGAAMYGTTDVATIIDRVRTYDPDLILYVVDHRQHQHFEQVFRAAELAELNGHAKLEHVGYGTVNGTDGKPFKTRAGGVMKLFDLIAMAQDEAGKRMQEQGIAADYSDAERADIAKKVGIAAIKFADLSNYRLTDYIFDLARFTRFEGKTGPYLQYAAVRIASILRKAREEGLSVGVPGIHSKEERDLILQFLALPEALAKAEANRAPNILCDYAFTLAQSFSRFYSEHHILSESDRPLQASRLGLVNLTLAVLAHILGILGIEIPERM